MIPKQIHLSNLRGHSRREWLSFDFCKKIRWKIMKIAFFFTFDLFDVLVFLQKSEKRSNPNIFVSGFEWWGTNKWKNFPNPPPQPRPSVQTKQNMYLHEYGNGGSTRPPPPPPAPPSTPVVKQHPTTQKYHHQLLQQLPKMLANGVKVSRPAEEFVWVDPSGRPTSPPRSRSHKNHAQNARKVRIQYPIEL